MSAALSSNTHQAYGLVYDKYAVGWGVPPNSSPKSGCAQFVDSLMDQVGRLGASVTFAGLGANLASHAKYTLAPLAQANKLAYDGFKENLIAGGQNGWAMVHIAGIAGAYLAGASSVIDKQFREDKAQLKIGLDFKAVGRTTINYGGTDNYSLDKYIAEKRAELEDDRAGINVGELLYDKVKGRATYSLVRTKIFNRLCDK